MLYNISLTPQQRDIVVRTIAGEAINQGPQGWAAVGSVIFNRSLAGGQFPSDPMAVALQGVSSGNSQFGAWGTREGNSLPRSISPQDPRYQAIGQVVDQLASGQVADPTNGGLYYVNPHPSWLPGGVPGWTPPGSVTAQIGQHVFYSGTPQQAAVMRQVAANSPDGVQTITPANAQDAMVPPSGAAPSAARAAPGQLAAPTAADVTPTTPSAPQGPSGAPAMVNGIINNDPRAIQAASQQIASDIQNNKVTQDQVKSYFNSLPADVASAAKTNYLASSDTITKALNAGINNSSALVKGISMMPAAFQPAAYTAGIKQADKGLATLVNAPTVSAWTTDWNKVAPTDPYSDANRQAVYGSLDATATTGGGVPSRPFGSVEPSPVSPVDFAGGPGFSNFNATPHVTDFDYSPITPIERNQTDYSQNSPLDAGARDVPHYRGAPPMSWSIPPRPMPQVSPVAPSGPTLAQQNPGLHPWDAGFQWSNGDVTGPNNTVIHPDGSVTSGSSDQVVSAPSGTDPMAGFSSGYGAGLNLGANITPSPVSSTINDPLAGRDPLTGALAAANPAASLTPDTGTGGLSSALAGVSTFAPPSQPTPTPQAVTPVPAAQPQPIRVSYGANGVPDGRAYIPGANIVGNGSFPGGNSSNGTNAWSGGYYSGTMPGGYASNYGFGSLGAGQFGNLGAASQYGGGAYGAPNSTT